MSLEKFLKEAEDPCSCACVYCASEKKKLIRIVRKTTDELKSPCRGDNCVIWKKNCLKRCDEISDE